jgi:hypothetical protein
MLGSDEESRIKSKQPGGVVGSEAGKVLGGGKVPISRRAYPGSPFAGASHFQMDRACEYVEKQVLGHTGNLQAEHPPLGTSGLGRVRMRPEVVRKGWKRICHLKNRYSSVLPGTDWAVRVDHLMEQMVPAVIEELFLIAGRALILELIGRKEEAGARLHRLAIHRIVGSE